MLTEPHECGTITTPILQLGKLSVTEIGWQPRSVSVVKIKPCLSEVKIHVLSPDAQVYNSATWVDEAEEW